MNLTDWDDLGAVNIQYEYLFHPFLTPPPPSLLIAKPQGDIALSQAPTSNYARDALADAPGGQEFLLDRIKGAEVEDIALFVVSVVFPNLEGFEPGDDLLVEVWYDFQFVDHVHMSIKPDRFSAVNYIY